MESMFDSIDSISEQQHDAAFDVTIALCEQYIKYLDICENSNNPDAIIQEGKILDEATGKGNKDESIIAKIVKFLPRLIGAIIKQIKRIFDKEPVVSEEQAFNTFGTIQPGGLTASELEDLTERRQNSPIYKAIIASGVVGMGAVATGLAFRISDYSKAVEFKDDVSFIIAADLSSIRVVFPFYKIEGVQKFLSEYSKRSKDSSTNKFRASIFSDDIFKYLVTNQSRVSERDFTPEEWKNYYEKEIKGSYTEFSNALTEIKERIENELSNGASNNPVKMTESELNKLLKRVENFSKKIPGDLELITKFNNKLMKVYNILAKPGEHSKLANMRAKRMTFKPLMPKDSINIYQIDTTHMMNAIREFNEFAAQSRSNDRMNVLSKIDPHYQNACREICKQFNCDIDFKITDGGGSTATYENKKGWDDITFSKTRGFDLHGARLVIYNDPRYVYSQVGEKLFGQMLCSIICHEIFHNVALLTHVYGTKITDAIKKTFTNAFVKFETAKQFIFELINVYSRAMDQNAIADTKTTKRLWYLVNNCDDDAKISSFTEKVKTDSDDSLLANVNVDNNIEASKFEIFMSKLKHFMYSEAPIVGTALIAIIYRYNFLVGGMMAISTLFISIYGFTQVKMEKTNEETMCDMCAAIYKLPVYLENVEKLRMNKGKRDIASHGRYDVHSATFDRQTVSLGLAKEILNSGEKLDPEVQNYLEFIVKKNEGNQYAERKFTKQQMKKSAPAFTENINRAISNFIKDHNIQLDS